MSSIESRVEAKFYLFFEVYDYGEMLKHMSIKSNWKYNSGLEGF